LSSILYLCTLLIKLKTKIVLENRKCIFDPTYKSYAASLDGYIVHAVAQEPTLGVLNESGFLEMTLENDWHRIFGVHDIIWEYFHGLLKYGNKVSHINEQRNDN